MANCVRLLTILLLGGILPAGLSANEQGHRPPVQFAAAACPAGQIACQDWCRKYKAPADQESCIRTHSKSCVLGKGGADVCVPDKCTRGRIRCEDWCKKNSEPHKLQQCLHHGSKSCMKKYGSLDACMK